MTRMTESDVHPGQTACAGFVVGMQAELPTKPSHTSLRHVGTLVSDVLCVTAWLKGVSGIDFFGSNGILSQNLRLLSCF